MAPGAPILFETHDSNIVQSRVYNWGEVDKIFAEADHVVSNSFRWNRCRRQPDRDLRLHLPSGTSPTTA
jgi:hypothetical protein